MDASNLPGPHGIDLHYQPLYKQAQELQNSFHARLADPFNPMSIAMRSEADQLVCDIESNKHPQDVEERIMSIEGHLRRAGDQSDVDVMSFENNQFFMRRYGSMREDVKKLPHYNQPRNQSNTTGGSQWL